MNVRQKSTYKKLHTYIQGFNNAIITQRGYISFSYSINQDVGEKEGTWACLAMFAKQISTAPVASLFLVVCLIAKG